MAKGLRTKSERFMQMIRQGDLTTFDANGARIICSNIEDYTFNPANSYDSVKRRGSNAKSFNALTDAMRTGDMNGALYYNLVDDQLLPYVFADVLPANDTTAAGVRTRVYEWAQSGRNDRPFFAIEEGAPGRAVRGLAGHYNSFKFTSKRGQNGQSRFSAGFTTTNAPEVGPMTGQVAQNSILNIVGANVTGNGVFSIKPLGSAAQNLTVAIGDTTAQIVAKLAAIGVIATVAGTVAVSSGETHTLTATNATGNATIYGAVSVVPGESAASLQAKVRALGGDFTDATVSIIGGSASGKITISGTGPAVGEYTQGADFNGGAAYYAADGRNIYGLVDGASNAVWRTSNADRTVDYNSTPRTTLTPPEGAWSGRDGNPAVQSSGLAFNTTYGIAFPGAAGNIADIETNPGANWTTSVTQAGNAVGSIVVTVTNPAQTGVAITWVSGAGWSGAVVQAGSNGILRSVLKAALPVLPQHLSFYVAETYAGLDQSSAYVGTVEEFELDIPKIREPRLPHNGQLTYSEVVDSEDVDIKLMVLLFADQGSSTRCQDMVANGEAYISKPLYWRVKCALPGTSYQILWEFYGSVGETVELEYGGNVEERRFHFDLIENLEMDWNLRVTTKAPV